MPSRCPETIPRCSRVGGVGVSREIGRFGGEDYEVGIYVVEDADVVEEQRKRGLQDRDAGEIELVWFDQQDPGPGWPVVIPRFMFDNLVQSLFEARMGLAGESCDCPGEHDRGCPWYENPRLGDET